MRKVAKLEYEAILKLCAMMHMYLLRKSLTNNAIPKILAMVSGKAFFPVGNAFKDGLKLK